VDAADLSDLMLNAASPAEAVAYFRRTSAEKPNDIRYQRGLAKSLIRAKSYTEATSVWAKVLAHPDANSNDKLGMADAQIRSGAWDKAAATLNQIPPTVETYQRYRLEAMVADSQKKWKRADSFYEIAVGLTTTPGSVLNNWGFSKLSRGDYKGAERLFVDALKYDDSKFITKNNLVLARSAQRKYAMPVMNMTQVERAQLLYTAGLSAVKQGDTAIAKRLFRDAVETHPQHFEEASRALETLENA
jgi:Tfp pilus assembly protein PilF